MRVSHDSDPASGHDPQSEAEAEAEAEADPLLGRRGRKEEARLPTLPTVEHHGRRARPFVAPQTPNQSTLRIDATAPHPHP